MLGGERLLEPALASQLCQVIATAARALPGLQLAPGGPVGPALAALAEAAAGKSEAAAGTVVRPKNVVFVLDTSGSMAGARIKKATENLVSIYDDYVFDEDHVAYITFASRATVAFPLARKMDGLTRLGQPIRPVVTKVPVAAGRTALFDALGLAKTTLQELGDDRTSWIVALTDGADNSSRVLQLMTNGELQSQNPSQPFQGFGQGTSLLVIGLMLDSRLKPHMEAMCRKVGGSSLYIDAAGGLEALDQAFEQVKTIITGGLTVEKF